MKSFFYADVFHYRYFAPISNFSSEQDTIELSVNFKIVKISKEDKERFLIGPDTFHSVFSDVAFKEFAFELTIDQEKRIGEHSPSQDNPETKARQLFDKACASLRLYKEGLVGFNRIWSLNQNWDFFGTSSSFSNGPANFYGEKMHLSKDEIPEYLDLLKMYEGISDKNRNKIVNAVNRLSLGTERARPEDKILDFFIGLESLFLNDKDPELKYRLSLYMAHWLGQDVDDRKKIFGIISKGYDQRSFIVHGGNAKNDLNVNGSVLPIDLHAKSVGDYLRQATKKFVKESYNQNKTENKLIDELREKILD